LIFPLKKRQYIKISYEQRKDQIMKYFLTMLMLFYYGFALGNKDGVTYNPLVKPRVSSFSLSHFSVPSFSQTQKSEEKTLSPQKETKRKEEGQIVYEIKESYHVRNVISIPKGIELPKDVLYASALREAIVLEKRGDQEVEVLVLEDAFKACKNNGMSFLQAFPIVFPFTPYQDEIPLFMYEMIHNKQMESHSLYSFSETLIKYFGYALKAGYTISKEELEYSIFNFNEKMFSLKDIIMSFLRQNSLNKYHRFIFSILLGVSEMHPIKALMDGLSVNDAKDRILAILNSYMPGKKSLIRSLFELFKKDGSHQKLLKLFDMPLFFYRNYYHQGIYDIDVYFIKTQGSGVTQHELNILGRTLDLLSLGLFDHFEYLDDKVPPEKIKKLLGSIIFKKILIPTFLAAEYKKISEEHKYFQEILREHPQILREHPQILRELPEIVRSFELLYLANDAFSLEKLLSLGIHPLLLDKPGDYFLYLFKMQQDKDVLKVLLSNLIKDYDEASKINNKGFMNQMDEIFNSSLEEVSYTTKEGVVKTRTKTLLSYIVDRLKWSSPVEKREWSYVLSQVLHLVSSKVKDEEVERFLNEEHFATLF
jgi:hypothetical protein